MGTSFTKLNRDWNAEPNAPDPKAIVDGADVVLEFLANPFQFRQFADGDVLKLRFLDAVRFRLGATNDEGWDRGQCRFSSTAPAWGEFYEVAGDLKLGSVMDWVLVNDSATGSMRHFLFYFRDDTFECTAADWRLEQ